MKDDEKILEQIFDKIESYDSVVIFGHRNPDGDCVGSVRGLKYQLLHEFPSKQVLCVGTVPEYLGTWIKKSDEVTDDVLSSSLAVMVDVSDLDRLEDERIEMSKEIVCIDHHVGKSEGYPFLNYREEEAPSATFILAKYMMERYHGLTKEAATYLYLGLVTDSGRFQFDANPETLRVAADIIAYGVDYKSLYNDLYRQNSTELKYRAYIYNNYEFNGKVAYCKIPKEAYLNLGISGSDAGGKVNLLSLLDNHPIWVMFLEQEDGIVRVEFRANGHYNVQKAAAMFGGGGHYSASGARIEGFAKIDEILKALNELPEENL